MFSYNQELKAIEFRVSMSLVVCIPDTGFMAWFRNSESFHTYWNDSFGILNKMPKEYQACYCAAWTGFWSMLQSAIGEITEHSRIMDGRPPTFVPLELQYRYCLQGLSAQLRSHVDDFLIRVLLANHSRAIELTTAMRISSPILLYLKLMLPFYAVLYSSCHNCGIDASNTKRMIGSVLLPQEGEHVYTVQAQRDTVVVYDHQRELKLLQLAISTIIKENLHDSIETLANKYKFNSGAPFVTDIAYKLDMQKLQIEATDYVCKPLMRINRLKPEKDPYLTTTVKQCLWHHLQLIVQDIIKENKQPIAKVE